MTKDEFNKVFKMIFAEYDDPGEAIKIVWWDSFKDLTKPEIAEAIRELRQMKVFGRPKTHDLWEAIRRVRYRNLPGSLKMSPEEALDRAHGSILLCRDASEFADRVAPEVNPQEDFGSERELQKALRIQRATWEREFKQRFERMQEECLARVRKGIPGPKAIVEVCAERSSIRLPDRCLKQLDSYEDGALINILPMPEAEHE